MGGNCGLSNCKAAGVEFSKHNELLLYHYEPESWIWIYKILAFGQLGFSLYSSLSYFLGSYTYFLE